ncbi:MAG: cbb3-type cytochrome oxidase assembly protein CcoS [Burkholderiales bacterium]
MDVLYMLVPLSVVLVFAIVAVLAWSVRNGQFEDIEQEGERILEDDDSPSKRPPP